MAKQKFVCGNCGFITSNPEVHQRCNNSNSLTHSWSAIPLTEAAMNEKPFNINSYFDIFHAFAAFVIISFIGIIKAPSKEHMDTLVGIAFAGAIFSGFFLRHLLKIVITLSIIGLVGYILLFTNFVKFVFNLFG
jgi:hypothetical protein